jgi:hypothetical protein
MRYLLCFVYRIVQKKVKIKFKAQRYALGQGIGQLLSKLSACVILLKGLYLVFQRLRLLLLAVA